jgi:hypothetical protein
LSKAADTRSCSSESEDDVRGSGTPAFGVGFGSGEGDGTFGSAEGVAAEV